MKTKLLLVAGLLAFAQAPCIAQDSWIQRPDIGGAERPMAVGFSIGTKGYAGIGNGFGANTQDLWEYDPVSLAWTQKADYPGAGEGEPVGFSIGGKGYVGMGRSFDGTYVHNNDFWEYDPATNSWTQKANLTSNSGRWLAIGFSIGGKGYIGGGREGIGAADQYLDDFWEYDPTTDTWTQKASLPTGGRSDAVGFNIGAKGYFGTGYFLLPPNGAGHADDFWEYDPLADTWTQKASVPGGLRSHAVGFSIGNKGYVGTGRIHAFGSSTLTNDFWEYNPATDAWFQQAAVGGETRFSAIGFSIGTNGFIGGGGGIGGGDLLMDLWEYGPHVDCLGILGGTALPGSACDDGNACTTADALNINCICVGIPSPDTDGDGICDANDNCPAQAGVIGSPCNDGDACTFPDELNALCQCAGTIQPDPDGNGICDSWIQRPDVGGASRAGAVGFSIGTKGYVGLGTANGTPDFWEYHPVSHTWAQKADYPGLGRARAVGFGIGSKGYVGTGNSTGGSGVLGSDDFWEYDPATNSWTEKADLLSGGSRTGATGFSISGKGYIGGGGGIISGSYDSFDDFWEYDPATDSWTQKTSLPGGSGGQNAFGFNTGAKGYLGTYVVPSTNHFWEYDPITDTWTQKASLPGFRTDAVGFSIGDKGYVGAGTGMSNLWTNDFWEYDPATDIWTQRPDFGGGDRSIAVGFGIGVNGFIGTGYIPSDPATFVGDFWEYGPHVDCLGVPGGAALPGSSCDDGSACTTGDAFNINCICVGIPTTDTDGDGICDDGDNCPSLPGQIGYACNDNNACTINDVITAACTCVGTVLDTDNDGVPDCSDNCPNTPGQMGDACDDGDPCTVNDNLGATCTCQGSFLDSDNDGICNALDNCVMVPGVIGSPCDDGDPCTINDELDLICLCLGVTLPDTDADGICDAQDDCPNTPGVIGSSCDDGNANSVNDVITAACTCEGVITPPDSWTVRADLPGTGRKDAVGFSIGNYGYIGTGSNDVDTYQDLWRFDPSNNTWTQMADVGVSLRTGAFAFATSTHGYVGEGMDEQGTYQQDLWEYGPLTNGWTLVSTTDPQGNGRFRAVAFSIGDIGYVGTGQTPFGPAQDLWSFDTGTGTWTSRAAFGNGLPRASAIGFSIGSKGYVGTGTDGFNNNNDFWEYDPGTDTWTQLGDFAGTARNSGVAFAIGTKGYLGTGEDNAGDLQDFHEYDPLTDSWTPRADYSGDIRHGATGFALNGRGYIGTGVNNLGFLADFREYTPVTTCTVGASCDDGLICTINDVYDGNCNCAGTPVNDADGDGVCDENDLCTGTPTGELVNTDGCSCSQLTLDDGIPCTLDDCTDGIVTHTLLDGDADLDGVCDGADACANTPTGEPVNAFGCACSEQSVDDGIACTVDDCLNGVVTHTLIDADADGVCDTDDACPGTASGAAVSATGCACAQLPTVCFDGACAAGPLVVGLNGPYSNVGASVQVGEPQPPTGSCNNQLGWCNGQVPSHSVWFSFVAPPSGQISLNFGTTNTWDSQIALWSAPDCNALLTGGAVLVAANDDYVGTPPYAFDAAIAPVCVAAGTTYYVQVDGYNTTTFDNFQLVLVEEATPNCDDGNACTADSYDCGTGQCTHMLQDADGDLVCDANDNCPSVAGQIGSSCTDNNANTIGDILNASCFCVGMPTRPEIDVALNGASLGGVLAWGDDMVGQATVPPATLSEVSAIAAGTYHSLALKSDGSVIAWGWNNEGQATVPSAAGSGVIAIAAGYHHSLALKSDGSVIAWGWNAFGQTNLPLAAGSGVIAIVAGHSHSLALKNDGSVIAWGLSSEGQTNVPAAAGSGVIGIAAGLYHSLALKSDGSVIAWGTNFLGTMDLPLAAASGVTAISASPGHCLALKSDGSVIAWGSDAGGQAAVPLTAGSGVTAIAAGAGHSLALKSDGSVIAWGPNDYGQTSVPSTAGSGVTAISAGGSHSLALRNALLPIGFGDQMVNTTSAAKTFTIRNSGNANLTGLAITATGANPGDFTVNTGGMLTTVTPDGSTTFSVTFTPASTGARSATLHIASNDDNENPYSIELTGNGLPADTDGDGVVDANDACAETPNGESVNAAGCACSQVTIDDGNACTLDECANGNVTHTFQDADGDGVCDSVDTCPLLANLVNGNTCDDGNACTISDVVTNCACAGTISPDTDNDGLCDAVDPCPLLANLVNGNSCDDSNACTFNDVVANCACAGTIQDSDGDGVCDANDNCPIVTGQIGSSCDDGDTNTNNDVLNANCQCAGTPTGCTTNPVTLTLNTDANASQITWYVMLTGTNTAVCSGSGLANSSSISVNCCLPNGCYDLVVTDDFGDGIAGGGYVLRDGNGNRIIDNAGNGASFTTLSLSPFGFCVPLSINTLQATSCDLENAALTTVLRAELNPAVTAQFGSSNSTSGYQFWVTNPNGGFTRRILLTHATPGSGSPAGTPAAQKASYFLLSFMNSSAPLIPKGILLNVRVRSQVAGVYSHFGPACRLIIPVPTCATTQLTTTASPVVSCGALGLTVSSTIWANNVPGATGYQFEFSRSGYTRRLLSGTRSTGLNFATLPLQVNFCYQVRVRVSFDNSATYCPFGPYCNITMGTANCNSGMVLNGSTDHISTADEARMTLWPNPNDGAVMNISLTEFDAAVSVVSMDVTDVFGKLVSTLTIPVQERYLNTAVNFEQELAPGLYLVNLTVGEHRYTERLVIH